MTSTSDPDFHPFLKATRIVDVHSKFIPQLNFLTLTITAHAKFGETAFALP